MHALVDSHNGRRWIMKHFSSISSDLYISLYICSMDGIYDSSSSSTGGSFFSMPRPSKIDHSKNHPSSASTAKAHQTPPTMLYFRPRPRPHPPRSGPSVRAALETLCATPCTVPRTDGSVTQLFTRMIAAGRANVRETTCSPTTNVKVDQTSHGMRGISTRKGMRAYEMGENGRNVRKDGRVPIRDWTWGYTKICRGRPMTPIMAVARPTRAEGRPMPPPKWKKPSLLPLGARGVGRNTNVMALKALVWKARRKWANRVRRTLRVQVWRNDGRLRRTQARARAGLAGADRLVTLPST